MQRNVHQAKAPRAQNKDLITCWPEKESEFYRMFFFKYRDSHMPSRIHSICLVLEVLHQAALFTPAPDHLEPLGDF
jgi:hypothetical protein